MTGAEIRKKREELGWKQYDLASRAGIGQDAISRVENGRLVSDSIMERIEGALAGKRYGKNQSKGELQGIPMIKFKDEKEAALMRKIWRRDYAPLRQEE